MPALVQSKSAGGGGAGDAVSTITVTPDSTPTSGNLIVVLVSERSGNSDWTVSSGSNWTQMFDDATEIADGTYRRTVAAFAKVSEGDETSVGLQVNGGTSSVKYALFMEFSPTATKTFDAVANRTVVSNDNGQTSDATSLSTGTTGSIATTDQLLIGLVVAKVDSDQTWGNGSYSSINLTHAASIYLDSFSGFGMFLSGGFADDTSTGTKASTASVGSNSNVGLNAALIVWPYEAGGANTRRYGLTTLGVS